jgi:Raf kinase inhibitor-like YbhB/YbcL family protein
LCNPDAHSKVWTHGVIFNLSSSLGGLEEGVETEKFLKNGVILGLNDSGAVGYSGPCPPGGLHCYFFKLYVLDIKLNVGADVSKDEILLAMEGHILDSVQLMGLYRR